MITIPRDDEGRADPSWCFGGPTTLDVFVRCANGHVARLDHDVAADGAVTPSLVCPHEGCTWHEHVRLEGWPGGES